MNMSPNVDKGHTTHFQCYKHKELNPDRITCCRCQGLSCQEKDAVYTQDNFEDVLIAEKLKNGFTVTYAKDETEKDYDIPPWWIAPEYSKAGMQDKDGFWHLDWNVEKIIKEARRQTIEEIKGIVKTMDCPRVGRMSFGQDERGQSESFVTSQTWNGTIGAVLDMLDNLEAMQ